MESELIQLLDTKHIWHPSSQMKDYQQFEPVHIKRARGSYLECQNGHKIIDAISSWWCKSLGHNHPQLKRALLQQLEQFEHVLLANTTSDVITQLSAELATLNPALSKVFYAGDGSSAVEIAMKMSLHSRVLKGETARNQFLALQNGYHGDTVGALSVSDIGIYRKPYETILFDVPCIPDLPYVNNTQQPLWNNAAAAWQQAEKFLQPYASNTTAIIFEPIVQGACGIKIYSQDFLSRLANWAHAHNIHLIADEIMTGIGRTGTMLACEHANITPDFVCLSKGLTSGWLPFSAVLTKDEIYQLFYDDFETGKAFLHSHTYSGNALAAAVALETLHVMRTENICQKAQDLQNKMMKYMLDIAEQTGQLTQVRGIGAIVAADLITDDPNRRLGYEVYQRAVQLGALLRPINNTIYWLPPLNIEDDTLSELKNITLQAIRDVICSRV